MQEYEHKQEIISSRVGCLGASDANLIASVCTNGDIPQSAMHRMAVVKGLVEPTDGIKTAAMKLGDDIEMHIFNILHEKDERWQSNYRLESKKYSKKNVKLIAHIDFFMLDEENKVVKMIECKATKDDTAKTQVTYKNQLYVQYMLGKELCGELGREWKLQLSLCHYCTATHIEFEPDNITLKRVKFTYMPFNIENGMNIINNYLETLESYYEDDEIDADMLPANVKEQFDQMAVALREISEREKKIEEFKSRLYDFFLEKGIKSVKNDEFSITLVAPTTSISFDYKSFLNEYAETHPILCKRLHKKYDRTTNRKGYVKINIKKN